MFPAQNRVSQGGVYTVQDVGQFCSVINRFGGEIVRIAQLPFERNSIRRQILTIFHTTCAHLKDILGDISYATQMQKFQIRQHVLALVCMQLQVGCESGQDANDLENTGVLDVLHARFFESEEVLQIQAQIGRYHRDVEVVQKQYQLYNGANGAAAKRCIRQLPIAGIKQRLAGYTFQGDVYLQVTTGVLYITFYCQADYLRFVGEAREEHKKSVGTYFAFSTTTTHTGYVVALDGDTDHFPRATQIHEQTHRYDAFIERADVKSIYYIARAEIVAYLSENTHEENIVEQLTMRKNGYMPSIGELQAANITPKVYRQKVKEFIKIAFKIKSKFPNTYLHLLGVTRITSWKFLLID